MMRKQRIDREAAAAQAVARLVRRLMFSADLLGFPKMPWGRTIRTAARRYRGSPSAQRLGDMVAPTSKMAISYGPSRRPRQAAPAPMQGVRLSWNQVARIGRAE